MSSGKRVGMRERGFLRIGLAGLQAVVEAAEETIEQIALSGGVSIAGQPAPVVMSSSTGGEAYRCEGPQVAYGGEAAVLDRAMENDQFLATGACHWRGPGVRLEAARISEPRAVVADLGQQAGPWEFAQTRKAGEDDCVRMLPKEDPCGFGQILLGLRRGLELYQQRERLAPHGLFNQSWLMQPSLSEDGLQPDGRSSDPALTAGTFQRRGELWPSQPGSVRRCRRDGQHRARIGVSQATWSPILEGLQEGRVLLAQQ